MLHDFASICDGGIVILRHGCADFRAHHVGPGDARTERHV